MIYTSLNNLKLIIFDVDGTLYDQNKLKNKILWSLFIYYTLRPWRLKELIIIYHFRKEREKHAGFTGNNLQHQQYLWCAEKVNLPLSEVKRVIDRWIFDFPNKYLKDCLYPGISSFFDGLDKLNIFIGIYSDYESKSKMESMELKAQLLVSSTDPNINSMKPLPKGLDYIINKFNINDLNECLFIGDKDELDGECARQAGIPYLIIDKKEARKNFYNILSKQILNEN